MDKERLALTPVKCMSSQPLQTIEEERNSKETTDEYISHETEDGEETAIRSVAVIKRSQVEFPVSFRELQSNTDLKTPPSNWLRGQFSICFPNLTPKRSDFTSFIMGYQFPDCIGEVDIVSDAENIKKLLKMAYNPSTHLSMMVHRIGKTILIDEFDIYKYLLRQSQCEWKWLRKFFYEHILESLARKEQNVLVRPDKSRDVVQRKNLLSKFLYHSMEDEIVTEPTAEAVPDGSPVSVRTISSPSKDNSIEVQVEENIPDSSVQPFMRNIIWNFEDLRMLIGTNLPIFGGRTHPCVSLRLRDMDKPINILTGIDYWLDNLMCNVPEVVMCYHQNGIVQKYELVKTEDLPHMADSQFSPQLVRDIAHNILSFLKSKATKEGHTYWLFKGKDDDIVKLYDLTSLCHSDGPMESFSGAEEGEEEDGDPKDNPFTVHVAMLFYCVAKNMWNSKEAHDKFSTVKSLLDNALRLLRRDKYPKIYCHSHLILADLFLPQDLDPDRPTLYDLEDDDVDLTKKERSHHGPRSPTGARREARKKGPKKECECNSINLATLCRRHGGKGSKHKGSELPKMSRNVYERCDSAIVHVIAALQFLASYSTEPTPSTPPPSSNLHGNPQSDSPIASERIHAEPRMARPFEPIPMPYEPLLTSPKAKEDPPTPAAQTKEGKNGCPPQEDEKTKSGCEWFLTASGGRRHDVIVPKTVLTGALLNSHLKDASWKDKIKFQLLRKASLIYMTKGRIELSQCNYGLCLCYVKLSLRSWCGMLSILGLEPDFPLPSQPLLLAGDAYYNLSKCWGSASTHIEDFNALTEEQTQMNDILEMIVPPHEDVRWSVTMPSDSVQAMMFSYQSFETAMKITNADPDFELKRRLAGICNELGCMFMNQADKLCHELGEGMKSGGNLWKESQRFIDKAYEIFKEVGDNDNLALLHCNKGRYLRLYAFHSSAIDGVQIFTQTVKEIYEKAFNEYEQALDISRSKQSVQKHVAESVIWEYSTTLFTFATIIQDTPHKNEEESEELTKYAAVIYGKCLKFCDSQTSSSKEPLYQYRAAVIHIRLATMYHEKYRRKRDSKMMYLAEMNYHKSALHFLHLDSSPVDIFKVHLDHVVLLQDAIEGMKSLASKWKSYLSILKLLIACVNGLLLIQRQEDEKGKGTERDKRKTKGGKGKEKRNEESEETSVEDRDLWNSFLELIEKKLQSTLLEILKMAKSNKSCNRFEKEVKEMYCLSLNKNKKSKDVHLLEAIMSIAPTAQKLFTAFKI